MFPLCPKYNQFWVQSEESFIFSFSWLGCYLILHNCAAMLLNREKKPPLSTPLWEYLAIALQRQPNREKKIARFYILDLKMLSIISNVRTQQYRSLHLFSIGKKIEKSPRSSFLEVFTLHGHPDRYHSQNMWQSHFRSGRIEKKLPDFYILDFKMLCKIQ